jgi:hypothetical protein
MGKRNDPNCLALIGSMLLSPADVAAVSGVDPASDGPQDWAAIRELDALPAGVGGRLSRAGFDAAEAWEWRALTEPAWEPRKVRRRDGRQFVEREVLAQTVGCADCTCTRWPDCDPDPASCPKCAKKRCSKWPDCQLGLRIPDLGALKAGGVSVEQVTLWRPLADRDAGALSHLFAASQRERLRFYSGVRLAQIINAGFTPHTFQERGVPDRTPQTMAEYLQTWTGWRALYRQLPTGTLARRAPEVWACYPSADHLAAIFALWRQYGAQPSGLLKWNRVFRAVPERHRDRRVDLGLDELLEQEHRLLEYLGALRGAGFPSDEVVQMCDCVGELFPDVVTARTLRDRGLSARQIGDGARAGLRNADAISSSGRRRNAASAA